MAPRIVRGKVIVGNSGADYGVRGYVDAYDAETGKLAWRFYTVPGDPSLGFENKAMEIASATWKGEWWKVGGGGTVWDGISYDPELDLLYVGVGNGGPWIQTVRSPGGGDNLFIASIVALRPDTGEYVWHYQTTPGDIWDYGAQAAMILTDLEIDGRKRRVLMQANKNGFFYVIDRQNGQFISARPFAKVTWATSIDPRTGRPIESSDARYNVNGALLSPRPGGAHNTPAVSFNPTTGLVYIPGVESSTFFREDPDFRFQPGRKNQGNRGPFTVEGAPPFAGFLLAWDPIQQKERWRLTEKNQFSGTITTAGNLVFAGSPENHFKAYTATTGVMVWAAEMPRDADISDPITYLLDGKQYVSVMSGYTNPVVVTFTLDGTAHMPGLKPTLTPVVDDAVRRN